MNALALNPNFHSSVAAYCSLNFNEPGIDLADRDRLMEFCLKIDGISDMFAEEISQEAAERPVWNLLLQDLKSGLFTEVIFPSVSHIAGQNNKKAADFFKFAFEHAITVKTIKEGFDSDIHGIEVALKHLPELH